MNLEKVAAAHDADIMILHTMVEALLATHPNASAALAAFKTNAEALVESAPADVSEEQIVELRARIAQNLIAWQRVTSSSVKR